MDIQNTTSAYLTFALGEEKFAIGVENVQEIVELDQVTKVPNAPPYMLGIINLRGRVLPLLDTRLKLGLPQTELTRKSRIIVLDLHDTEDKSFQIGTLVDVAKEVVELAPSDIQDAPEFESYNTHAPITGIVNRQGDITMVMDIARIFSTTDVVQLKDSVN